MIEIKFLPVRKNNSVVHFIVVSPLKPEKTENLKSLSSGKVVKNLRKTEPEKIIQRQNKKAAETTIDTSEINQKINFSKSEHADTSKERFKYASTFLDSFLVKHPEFARYILQQQAKNLINNKNNSMFAKEDKEKKVNDELHKYLKENFPEGSEHAMDENLGPGIHIPIDGLIDAIRKIFK